MNVLQIIDLRETIYLQEQKENGEESIYHILKLINREVTRTTRQPIR